VVNSAATKLRQFKSFVRTVDLTTSTPVNAPLTGRQVRQLRAALAAVNTMDLRDSDDTVTSRTITLTGSNGAPQYSVDVFGAEKQPYISEIFIDWDPTKFKEYFAVELYNPHAVPISLAGMKMVSVGRDTVPPFMREVANLTALGSIGPGERVLVENPGNNLRPPDVQAVIPANTRRIDGDQLTLAVARFQFFPHVQRELYLMRPRGSQTVSDKEWDRYNENKLCNLVPIDQIDLTHIIVAPPQGQVSDPRNRFRWRYARATAPSTNPKESTAWQCVYPGPYRYPSPPGFGSFAELISYNQWPATDFNSVPATLKPGLGLPKAIPLNSTRNKPWCTFGDYERPLQMAGIDAAGPNAGNGLAPYGGFARNGDILQVPFIGSYTIRAYGDAASDRFLDMVSLPQDSTYAEDGDSDKVSPTFDPTVAPPDPRTTPPGELADDYVKIPDADPQHPTQTRSRPVENVGRFAPLFYPLGTYTYFDDYAPLPLNVTPDHSKKHLVFWDQLGRLFNSSWRYHFALDLFDYLDVRSPQDDYLPNVDPGDPYSGTTGGIVSGQAPDPVNNGPGTLASGANQGHEDGAGEEGKVNVNTASWRVLAAVPMITDSAGNIVQPDNTILAKAIVYYREVDDGSDGTSKKVPHGPFRSLFELLKVPGFQQSIHRLNDVPNVYEVEADDADGDFAPYNRNPAVGAGPPETDAVDHVYSDFKAQNLALTRISNLLTTRSDSFTVYVLVQAWRGAGTDSPELVGQRRVVFLADRTSVRPLPPPGPNAPSVAHTPMNIVIMPNN
jgi:hypothetical protein